MDELLLLQQDCSLKDVLSDSGAIDLDDEFKSSDEADRFGNLSQEISQQYVPLKSIPEHARIFVSSNIRDDYDDSIAQQLKNLRGAKIFSKDTLCDDKYFGASSRQPSSSSRTH